MHGWALLFVSLLQKNQTQTQDKHVFHALSLLRGEETRLVFRCPVSTPTVVTTCVEVYTLDS